MDNTTLDIRRREWEKVPLDELVKSVKALQRTAEDASALARVAGEVLKGRAQDLINSLSV